MAAVEVSSLSKRFGSVEAVSELSFRAEPGRVTGFLGPNGAGKSTTLRALLGLVRPSFGTATIAGRSYADLDQPTRHVGAVLEDTAFHPGRSGLNHLRVLAATAGLPPGRAEQVLELVGLGDAGDRRVKGYSLGMRQRLAIGGALLGDPRVLILDEPANGLDPPGIRWLRDLMRSQALAGRTVLVSSHVLAEVAQVVDDVVVIARGRLKAAGPLAEVLGGGQEVATTVRSPDAERLAGALTAQGRTVERTGPDALLVHGATPEEIGRLALEHNVVIAGVAEQTRSLETAFLELTGEGTAT